MSQGITDYNTLFICCRGEDHFEVNGSCEVKPPQSWCVMFPERFDDVVSIGTACNSTVIQHDDSVIMNATESSSWALSNVGKLN